MDPSADTGSVIRPINVYTTYTKYIVQLNKGIELKLINLTLDKHPHNIKTFSYFI